MGTFDSRLLSQAFGNLIKNAAEAIEAAELESGRKGTILIRAARHGATFVVDVIDNGKGLPRENRQRLLEPYMTTREKGTGLGLAIVTKIAEEHGGRIELLDAAAVGRDHRGACVRLILPPSSAAPAPAASPSAASPSAALASEVLPSSQT
jgi:two-component system nitrogen regulation sensor histidine kinase NtrY